MKTQFATSMALSVALLAGVPPLAVAADAVVVAPAELTWQDMGHGVSAAPVEGDMAKGASRFFLKYPAGLVTPNHHHSANHHVTLVSGRVTLTVEGKAYKLEPGAYFSLSNQVAHTAQVEGGTDALFFIQAEGPWDVVPEQ